MAELDRSSRREFVTDVAKLTSAIALAASATPLPAHASARPATRSNDWNLAWLDIIAKATDRAVFDWPSIGDPGDPIVMEMAERYLDNCAAAYGSSHYVALAVLNIRTNAVPAALTDAAWERYSLGAEYNVKDPVTQKPAIQNPFWHRAPDPAPGIKLPTLAEMIQRDSIVLVCDLAMGRLATRLAGKTGRQAEDVHRDLLASFIPRAFSVPSGIFGLARSQNAGCAFVRV